MPRSKKSSAGKSSAVKPSRTGKVSASGALAPAAPAGVSAPDLHVGVYRHSSGVDVALYQDRRQCLLGLLAVILEQIVEGTVEMSGAAVGQFVGLYKSGDYEGALEVFNEESYEIMEVRKVSSQQPLRPWTENELNDTLSDFRKTRR